MLCNQLNWSELSWHVRETIFVISNLELALAFYFSILMSLTILGFHFRKWNIFKCNLFVALGKNKGRGDNSVLLLDKFV
jgi:hypothetical protein